MTTQTRVEDASNFLSICDWCASPALIDRTADRRLRQWLLLGRCERALRIAAGIEKWPD